MFLDRKAVFGVDDHPDRADDPFFAPPAHDEMDGVIVVGVPLHPARVVLAPLEPPLLDVHLVAQPEHLQQQGIPRGHLAVFEEAGAFGHGAGSEGGVR